MTHENNPLKDRVVYVPKIREKTDEEIEAEKKKAEEKEVVADVEKEEDSKAAEGEEKQEVKEEDKVAVAEAEYKPVKAAVDE